MIKAVVFDLDGTLIESEPCWKEAEIKIFRDIGVPLTYKLTEQTNGLGCIEVIKYWYARFGWDKVKYTFVDLERRITEEVIAITKQKGFVKEGAAKVVDFIKSKNLPVSIASSSTYPYIRELVHFFGLESYFPTVFSAVDYGYVKPHPAVYLAACEHFKVYPFQALAFEDSFVGLISAKAAQMKALAMLNNNEMENTTFDFADYKLSGFEQFTPEVFELLNEDK